MVYDNDIFIYARNRRRSLAEDIVQESFIRIIKNFDKINKKKCPQTKKYFVTIVKKYFY